MKCSLHKICGFAILCPLFPNMSTKLKEKCYFAGRAEFYFTYWRSYMWQQVCHTQKLLVPQLWGMPEAEVLDVQEWPGLRLEPRTLGPQFVGQFQCQFPQWQSGLEWWQGSLDCLKMKQGWLTAGFGGLHCKSRCKIMQKIMKIMCDDVEFLLWRTFSLV